MKATTTAFSDQTIFQLDKQTNKQQQQRTTTTFGHIELLSAANNLKEAIVALLHVCSGGVRVSRPGHTLHTESGHHSTWTKTLLAAYTNIWLSQTRQIFHYSHKIHNLLYSTNKF